MEQNQNPQDQDSLTPAQRRHFEMLQEMDRRRAAKDADTSPVVLDPNTAAKAGVQMQFGDAARRFVTIDTSKPNYEAPGPSREKGRIRVGKFVLVSMLSGPCISEVQDDGSEFSLRGSLVQQLAYVVETLAAQAPEYVAAPVKGKK